MSGGGLKGHLAKPHMGESGWAVHTQLELTQRIPGAEAQFAFKRREGSSGTELERLRPGLFGLV